MPRRYGRLERKYRELFESTVDGIVKTDRRGRYLEVNKAFLKMTGYTQEELNKTNFRELTPQKWHSIDAKIIREQILKRGYSDEWEKEYF